MDDIMNSNQNDGFVKSVFNLDEENKNELVNLLQYSVIALIPIHLILKAIKHFIPEEDETKGSLEIMVEIVGQVVFIVSSIWFLDRIIRYIPTYTGSDYDSLNATTFIIPFLIILSTMQTKFGFKMNILFDRAIDAWNGKAGEAPAQTVRVSQPIAPQHQVSRADTLDTDQLLPSNRQLTSMPSNPPSQESQNFNQMYNVEQLQNAAKQPSAVDQEPMAANDNMFGGSPW